MSTSAIPQRGAGRVIFASIVLILVSLAIATLFGAKQLSGTEIWQAIVRFDAGRNADVIIWDIRMPRIVMGALVGAGLALAGAIMQSLTQNPLASPTLTGVNAGGSLAVLVGILTLPGMDHFQAICISFVGGAAGLVLVYTVASASRSGPTPVRLALSGIMVSAVLTSLAGGLVHLYTLRFEDLYWTMGGLNNVLWEHVALVAPIIIAAAGGALFMAPQLTVIGLGRDLATGLGVSTGTIRAAGMFLALLLAGSAVSVAGPVGFVGLMVPHISRMIVGIDYRKVIPLSMGLGTAMVVLPDIFCRLASSGFYPVGMLTSLIGGCFFVILARRGGR